MLAEKIMITQVVTAVTHERVGEVHDKMNTHKLRMIPVVDQSNCVLGVLSTFSIMQSIIPEYLNSGDLQQISYAPDLDIVQRNYISIMQRSVQEFMDTSPLFVHKNDSLLSVAAAISAHGKHEYALVVDHEKRLLGIISSGDILNRLKLKANEV